MSLSCAQCSHLVLRVSLPQTLLDLQRGVTHSSKNVLKCLNQDVLLVTKGLPPTTPAMQEWKGVSESASVVSHAGLC